MQNKLDLKSFKRSLGTSENNPYTAFWGFLIKQSREINKGAKLRAITPWFVKVFETLN